MLQSLYRDCNMRFLKLGFIFKNIPTLLQNILYGLMGTLNTAASLLCGANILANIRKFAKVKIDPCLGMPRGTAL